VSESDDINDVRQMDARGKPTGSAKTTALQRRRVLQAFKRALTQGDERAFLEAIRRDLGLRDGSPEFVRAVELWRKTRNVS
jgi:hypothetical protein